MGILEAVAANHASKLQTSDISSDVPGVHSVLAHYSLRILILVVVIVVKKGRSMFLVFNK